MDIDTIGADPNLMTSIIFVECAVWLRLVISRLANIRLTNIALRNALYGWTPGLASIVLHRPLYGYG